MVVNVSLAPGFRLLCLCKGILVDEALHLPARRAALLNERKQAVDEQAGANDYLGDD